MSHAALPSRLAGRPFTRHDALAAGITDQVLRGPRVTSVFRGVYVYADVELTLVVRLWAALLVLPRDAVVSHVTAVQLYGLDIGSVEPLHFSTRTSTHSRQTGVVVHRRLHEISRRERRGLPVTGPHRTVVDIATKVGLVDLVTTIEWMMHVGLVDLDRLTAYPHRRHLDGVKRLRRALPLVRRGVESPMESVLRLMLAFARLPGFGCNVRILDDDGVFIARGDLVHVGLRLVVEYDGRLHDRDDEQRSSDHRRRERLVAAGWVVITIVASDMHDKRAVVERVHTAMVQQGYRGRPPTFSTTWMTWFGPKDRAGSGQHSFLAAA